MTKRKIEERTSNEAVGKLANIMAAMDYVDSLQTVSAWIHLPFASERFKEG